MVLKKGKGFSTEEWRRALAEAEEEEENDAQRILQPLTNLKINDKINDKEMECGWDVFTQEILPRLSPNQLQKLKSVCQNWNRTISSPYFALLHLKIYNNQTRIRVLVAKNYFDWRKPEIREYKCDEETKRIPYPPEIRERPPAILGSCDGLLCLRFGGLLRTIATYNPSTGKYFWVKSRLKDYYSVDCSWFGHHPCSGEYVLVLGNFDGEVGVYKFNRRSNLNKVHSTSCRINPQGVFGYYEERVGTLLHGALHWPVYRSSNAISRCYSIFVYHLEDNKHFEISPPARRNFWLSGLKLGVAEGCLFAFIKAYDVDDEEVVFELWIMKEYKVHQSWTKYANIQGFENRVVAPLAFFRNGNDLILHPNKSGLIKYTFNDDKAALLLVNDNEAIMCADSLVSPEIVGK